MADETERAAMNEEEEEEEEREKWVTHYCSLHQILLVGEGDFSFSLCLAQSFGSASNIVATSLDRYDTVIKKYSKAKSNLKNLEKLGATLLHGVDATKMKLHTDLQMRKFDRIIFNFPHAGFHGKEDQVHLIKMHRNLVQGFFKNASRMLRPYGEVHVNHKTTAPFHNWDIEELASRHTLGLIECVDFKKEDYPGYNNKRGEGLRCDEPFPLRECSTFKFRISFNAKKMTQATTGFGYTQRRSLQVQQILPQIQRPTSFDIGYPRTDFIINMHGIPGYVGSPSTIKISYECSSLFDGYFTDAVEMFGRADYDVVQVCRETLKIGFERYMAEAPGRTIYHYIMHLQELRRLSILRSAWMRRLLLGPDR